MGVPMGCPHLCYFVIGLPIENGDQFSRYWIVYSITQNRNQPTGMFNSAQLGDFLLSHDHLWLGWFLGVPMTLNKNVADELQKCDIFQNNWASWHVPTLIDYINKYRYLSYMGKWELLNIMWQGSIIYRLYQLYEGFLLNRATPSYHPWHVRIFHQKKKTSSYWGTPPFQSVLVAAAIPPPRPTELPSSAGRDALAWWWVASANKFNGLV